MGARPALDDSNSGHRGRRRVLIAFIGGALLGSIYSLLVTSRHVRGVLVVPAVPGYVVGIASGRVQSHGVEAGGVLVVVISNALLYGALASAVMRACLRRRRYPPNCCNICGYNLTMNVSGKCPECGAVVTNRAGPPERVENVEGPPP